MKKEKKYRISSLVSLYMNYTFQKTTLIIFIISLILITLFLVLLANPNQDKSMYLLNYESIHNSYLSLGLFIIQIFNSIIIATITISIILNSVSFDSLFISYTPRHILCIAKILAITISMVLLSVFEILILNIIPLIIYSKYSFDITVLIDMLYLFVANIVESSFSIMFTTLFASVISPMIIMYIFVVIRLLCNNFTYISNNIEPLMPILKIDNTKLICSGIYISIIWIILIYLLYIFIYNIKDLKNI